MMSDAARQERRRMDAVSKTKATKAKARAEMSDAAIHTHNAKKRKQMAKVRAEMSDAARQEQNAKAQRGAVCPVVGRTLCTPVARGHLPGWASIILGVKTWLSTLEIVNLSVFRMRQ